jgi:predicted Rdx family selenoprotein
MEAPKGLAASAPHPRIVIKFCTQCKWMLRAAYVCAREHISFDSFLMFYNCSVSERALTHVTTSLRPSYMNVLLAFWFLIYSIYILQPYLVILAHYSNYSQFAQELLSTFSTDLGEVALQPATGGVFSIEIFYHTAPSSTTQAETGTVTNLTVESKLLWDRKTEGGFPGKFFLPNAPPEIFGYSFSVFTKTPSVSLVKNKEMEE